MPADAQIHELPFTHFVLVHLDADDKACLKVSQSIANGWQPILSANVIDAFLRAVAMSREAFFTNSQGEYHADSKPPFQSFVKC